MTRLPDSVFPFSKYKRSPWITSWMIPKCLISDLCRHVWYENSPKTQSADCLNHILPRIIKVARKELLSNTPEIDPLFMLDLYQIHSKKATRCPLIYLWKMSSRWAVNSHSSWYKIISSMDTILFISLLYTSSLHFWLRYCSNKY